MQKKEEKNIIGVFPAPTLSQLEYILDERQNLDRRKQSISIDFEDRRKFQRREADREEALILSTPLAVSSG